MDAILKEHSEADCLPTAAATEFQTCVFTFLQLQTSLRLYYGDDIKLFNETIKSHYLAHEAILCQYINPMKCWTYMGEDFMQKVKRLAAGCVVGNNAREVQRKIMRHYCYSLFFLTTDESVRWWR